jgi:hypothetical protein
MSDLAEYTADGERITGNPEPVDGLCNSWNRFRRHCANRPMLGKTRCRNHGGKNKEGLDLPQTKSGRWSKHLPTNLAARYDELASDAEIVNLGHDIGLLDTRIAELLGRLDTAESEIGWIKARQAYTALTGALSTGDAGTIRTSMQALSTILNGQVGIDQTWRDVREALQERRLLVESERRRLVDMNQMVTVEELLILIARVSDIIQRNVSDEGERRAISIEIRALMGTGGGAAARALARRPHQAIPVVAEVMEADDGE